ncbi:MAG: heparinase II/III family protein [Bacteroidales bacterium]|nr:heparinase II/III family protein [Bacteroidales bacterium]
MICTKRLFLLFAIFAGVAAFAQMPVPHPRLLMREGAEPQENAGGVLAKADSIIVAFSDAVLDEPAVTRTMVGRRLLHTSREALKRIFWLGYTYRVHGGEAYARKAIDEMLAVSAFSDWNPSHFLDVGEMTMAAAIGYDWLYGQMTAEERTKVARAIIDKGLKPALHEADAWFYRSEINWNPVCNAGMVYGALAVWEEDPDFCRSMLEKSLESRPLAFKAYEGGGYPEGYNYWGYGTSFQIMLEAALASAFDVIPSEGSFVIPSEAKESIPPDFLASADFIRFTSTPAGNCYSFSDSYRKASGQYMQAWMQRRVGDPSLLYPEIRIMEDTGYKRLCEERLFPMLLISLADAPGVEIDPPEEHYFQCEGTTPIFVYRSGWTSRDDDYLGVKGGFAMSSHSHIDQGSFYFESDGVAWATDLGMQDYNSLESAGVDIWDMLQDSERWTVFRLGPFSHNILTINGEVPKVNRTVPFRRTLKPDRPTKTTPAGAELSLGHLYDDVLDNYTRKVLFDGDDLIVEDRLQAGDSTCTVRWAMCSEANATLYGGMIVLYTEGKHRLLSASTEGSVPDLTPHLWPTSYDPSTPEADGMQYLHETDAPNPGTSLVGYTFTLQPHQRIVLRVRLSRL